MTTSNYFTLACGCFLAIQISAQAQLPPTDSKYKLVFDEEFDKTYGKEPVDSKKWARSTPTNLSDNQTPSVTWCFPGETKEIRWDRAYIVKDPTDTTTVSVSNGTCKIKTNKTPYQGQVSNWPACDPNRPGYAITGEKCKDSCRIQGTSKESTCWTTSLLPFKYTTGTLFSRQKFHYGYFEMRFKLPPASGNPESQEGFGPNFWLNGNNRPVNYYSEIDIFEIIAYNPSRKDTNLYMSTVYYSDKDVKILPSSHTEVIGNKLKNDTSWHKAAAWWTKDFVKFYLDDSLFYTVQGRPDISVDKLAEMNIFIDINSPTNGRCNNFTDQTQFPYVYEIDYVRVYQEK